MMKLKVLKKSINELFALKLNEHYTIPKYQREYSWLEENFEDFFHDVTRAFDKEELEIDYFGTITINRAKSNLEIVDGQQRMVTILLFLKALGINFNGRIPLKLEGTQNDVFEEILNRVQTAKSKKVIKVKG